jgi:hypothetical protein
MEATMHRIARARSRLWTLPLVLGASVALRGDAPAEAADHRDAPLLTNLGVEAQLDINDLYVFASPQTPGNTVMILTVNPLAGLFGPRTFAFGANHDFNIDLDLADAANADATFRVSFKRPDRQGVQRFKVQAKGPASKFVANGVVGDETALPGGGRIQAGLFDDPFFFDLLGFRRALQFSQTTASNFFKGLNTLAIVLEVPDSTFDGAAGIGVWCATGRGRKQVDRMGRPAINTVLVAAGRKDEFNRAHPRNDLANFGADATGIITSLSNAGNATTLVPILFPDLLTYAPGNTSGFLNGRRLEDDVIDAELDLLSAGAVDTDFVANDSTFLTVFPYLAAPNP